MTRLNDIRYELEQIKEQEAKKLFRLCRKAALHDCSMDFCMRISNEAWLLSRMNVERLLDPFIRWEFAFKFGRDW